MNQELIKVFSQIAEFSARSLARISEGDLENIRAAIAQYVDGFVLCDDEEIKNILVEGQKNVLHIAAKFGETLELKRILDRVGKTYINSRDENFFTPIHHAAKNGWAEAVQLLLENGAQASPKSAPKDREWMPIHYAAKAGHLEVVKTLLANRVDKEVKTSFGLTPLVVAAEFGHLPIVEFLLAQNANKNVKTIEENHCMNALHYAAVGGFADVAAALLKAGIDKELKTSSGSTALHFAAGAGFSDVVEVLLQSGVNRDVKTEAGHDILYLAALKGKKDVVSLLLKWGVGDFKMAAKIATANSHKEISDLIESYDKAVKNIFNFNLSENFFEMIKSFSAQNLAEAKINLENGVSFNAYGILGLNRKVGFFKKENLSLMQLANKNGEEKLSKSLMSLAKLAGSK